MHGLVLWALTNFHLLWWRWTDVTENLDKEKQISLKKPSLNFITFGGKLIFYMQIYFTV